MQLHLLLFCFISGESELASARMPMLHCGPQCAHVPAWDLVQGKKNVFLSMGNPFCLSIKL